MTDQKNLILAIVLSVGILFAFQYFVEGPRLREAQRQAELQAAAGGAGAAGEARNSAAGTPEAVRPVPSDQPSGVPGGAGLAPAAGGLGGLTREQLLAQGPRLPIDNGRLHGSVALRGGRIDDVRLVDYRETLDPNSPEIVLLSPAGMAGAYFVEQGWVPAAGGAAGAAALPDANTLWTLAEGDRLAPGRPVVLRWDNGAGLAFERRLEIDSDYMLTVTQAVTNGTAAPVALHPYGLVSRWGTPATLGFYILHEGAVGVLGGTLREVDYDDFDPAEPQRHDGQGGWLGFTDKYWLAALVPDQAAPVQASFRETVVAGQERYQADYLGPAVTVEPGATVSAAGRVFAGAKQLELLTGYGDRLGIPLFDYAVDFGWFFFLTKPIYHVLNFFHGYIGNYGVAILLLTLLVKLLFFPLANKSYKAMGQMKLLGPKMTELRERFGDDKARLNQELMALYKREKVNPMAGCLPIVVQIPVFFALYKVLFVSIEMRHAPFFGWIQDLSAPDPTTVFNLFGLLPFTPPAFLMLGVWPLLMGFTMFLQTKLNPQPADPIQAKVMLFLPVIFTFLFATFPAGLVIYWTWNNVLSIAQQWLIMRRAGVAAPAKA